MLYTIGLRSNKVLSESLDLCVDENDANVNFLLRGLATHAMVQAVYFSTG
jgi:DIS3-like exonuclease 1